MVDNKGIEQFKKQYKSRLSKIGLAQFIISIFFIIFIIVPITRMLFYIDNRSFLSVINSPYFTRSLINSIKVSSIATILSIIMAYMLAWSVERTNIKYKNIMSIILVLPMLIPSISHGMGLIILFGNNGILTKLLNLKFHIYGMWGIVVGAIMYSFPIAFLFLVNVMKYEDSSPYEAARVLGIPRWRQFTAITLPYLRKPLISIVFAIFTMISTDYGIPLIVGGKFTTIPVVLYQEVIGLLEFGKGSVYGTILLIPAVLAFIIDILNKDKGNQGYITRKFELGINKTRDFIAYAFCAIAGLFVLLPIVSFLVLGFTKKYPMVMTLTFNNIKNTLLLNGGKYLLNSIIIAFMVSIIGTGAGFIIAYMTARLKSKFSKLLHLITITSMAVPGIVLGLSYVLVFNKTFIYGKLIILIMVNLIHFIASPYLLMYDSLNKINENLESVGHVLGISRFRMIKDVILPQSKSTIVEMFSYFFVNSMMTISAVSFLANTNNKPISLMINQFEAQMQLENAAIVSLSILLINILTKGLIYFYHKKPAKRSVVNSD